MDERRQRTQPVVEALLAGARGAVGCISRSVANTGSTPASRARGGTILDDELPMTTAPTRSPPAAAVQARRAAARTTTADLSCLRVPKNIAACRSASSQTGRSRSSRNSLVCGRPRRAVTRQSMVRGSSPADVRSHLLELQAPAALSAPMASRVQRAGGPARAQSQTSRCAAQREQLVEVRQNHGAGTFPSSSSMQASAVMPRAWAL